MSRATALRLGMAMLTMATGLMVAVPRSGAEVTGVAVRDSSFTPGRREIAAHDTVIFARDSQLAHSITSDTGAFPEQEFPPDQRAVGFRFNTPGTYPYYCKYHGGPGGAGMSGVIFVTDQAPTTSSSTPTTDPSTSSTSTSSSTTSSTTTTTKPPTTTTTKPPTTTTTKPPTTTTTKPPTTTTTAPPSTTTTTEPPPIITPPPPVPPISSAETGDPPAPPPPSPEKKKKGDPSTTSTSARDKVAAAVAPDDSATTSTEPPALPEDIAALADPEPVPEVEETPPPSTDLPPDVQTLDDLSLGRLSAQDQLPKRDRSGFLIGGGIAMAIVLLLAGAWAWYHRPSRYLPA